MYPLILITTTLCMLGCVWLVVVRSSPTLARAIWMGLFTVVIAGGASMMIAHSFVARWAFAGDEARHGLFPMMDGTAHRPFVYRRLVPDMLRIATDFSLEHVPREVVDRSLEKSTLERHRGDQSWSRRKAIAFHLAHALVCAAFFGLVVAGAGLLRAVRARAPLEAVVTATVATCLIPLTFVGGGYLYDAFELFLWTALLCIILRGWLWAVPFVFALMLVNKESALLVVPVLFPLFYRRVGIVSALRWTSLLGVMGCGWLWFVRNRYATLPGQPMEWWLPENLAFWSRPTSFLGFAQLYSPGLLAPKGANLLILVFLGLSLRFGWRGTPSHVRMATVLMTAVLAPLFLTSGAMDETRALGLLFPFLFVVGEEGARALFTRQEAHLREENPATRMPPLVS